MLVVDSAGTETRFEEDAAAAAGADSESILVLVFGVVGLSDSLSLTMCWLAKLSLTGSRSPSVFESVSDKFTDSTVVWFDTSTGWLGLPVPPSVTIEFGEKSSPSDSLTQSGSAVPGNGYGSLRFAT